MIQDELSSYYYSLGLDLAKGSNMTEGIEALKKAVGLKPSTWNAWNVLGLCLYRLGDFQSAKDAWEKSISIYDAEGENPAAHYIEAIMEDSFINLCNKYNSSLSLAKKGNFKEAARILESKDFHNCQIVKFVNLWGLCKFAQGRRKEAVRIWSASLQIDVGNEDTIRYITEAGKEICQDIRIMEHLLKLIGLDKFKSKI